MLSVKMGAFVLFIIVESADKFRFSFNISVHFVNTFWGFSSAGRAPALQAGGQRFDPANLHQTALKADQRVHSSAG